MLLVWLFVYRNHHPEQRDKVAMNWFVTFWLNRQFEVFAWRDAPTSRSSVHCQRSFISIQWRRLLCLLVWIFRNVTFNKEIFIHQLNSSSCPKALLAMSCISSVLIRNHWLDHKLSARLSDHCLSVDHCQRQQKFTSRYRSKASHWLTTLVSSSSASIIRATPSHTSVSIPTITVGVFKSPTLRFPYATNTSSRSLQRRRRLRPTISVTFSANWRCASRPRQSCHLPKRFCLMSQRYSSMHQHKSKTRNLILISSKCLNKRLLLYSCLDVLSRSQWY